MNFSGHNPSVTVNATSLGDGVLTDIRIPTSLLPDHPDYIFQTRGELAYGDLIIKDGAVAGMQMASSDISGVQIAGENAILIPPLVEAHCHLDKCHTIGRMHDIGGDLDAAGDAQWNDKAHWTYDDIHARASLGLRELKMAQCGLVRTHVDWPNTQDDTPIAWQVLNDLKAEWQDRLSVQIAALVDLDRLAEPDMGERIARQIHQDNGVLGVFLLGHQDLGPKLDRVFRLAQHYDLPLDFHVDESMDGEADALEAVVDTAIKTGFAGPLLCGHACSLSNRSQDQLSILLDKIRDANVTLCALPHTNLYLQGRRDDPLAPIARGMMPIKAVKDAGIPMLIGSDNVGDAYCPMGAHDPLKALSLAAIVAHIDPPYGAWLHSVTGQAASALGFAPMMIAGAILDGLLVSDAPSLTDLVAGRSDLFTSFGDLHNRQEGQ